MDYKSSYGIGKIFFYIGLFLLPSALSLGIIFLLVSSLVGFKINSEVKSFYKEKYSFFFTIGCFFLILSSLVNFLDENSINNIYGERYLTILGLINWLPLIFCFRSFQKYLKHISDRRRCFFILISGTVPVIISCIGQIFFELNGPFETLFGLITWFQRPIDGTTGVTGLFSNPNYLSAWLIIIWPFCLAIITFKEKEVFLLLFKMSIVTLTPIFIVLTASRAALICLIISVPLFYGSKIYRLFFSLLGLLSFIFINLSIPILGKSFQEILRSIIPEGLWSNYTLSSYETLEISRLGIWIKAIDFIKERPLLGHGSSSFPKLLFNNTEIWKGHAHNLPLELMVNYGIPGALFLLIPIFFLIALSFRKIFIIEKKINKTNICDRAWISSSILLLLMHLVDIQYFDARINVVGWILISGLKNITNSDEYGNSLNEKINNLNSD